MGKLADLKFRIIISVKEVHSSVGQFASFCSEVFAEVGGEFLKRKKMKVAIDASHLQSVLCTVELILAHGFQRG